MIYKLEDIVDLKIGRTPPRKEQKWFNQDNSDWKWISIKDMGDSGRYISKTSETISKKGQDRFNIPIVKKGTVILSFKLTVGRVSIVEEDMLTNEAIAQLPIKNKSKLLPLYLYYLLKNYKFEKLGSTSSIATAVNSNYLKQMEIDIPPLDEQKRVVELLDSIDKKIEINNEINDNLQQQAQAIFIDWFINSIDSSKYTLGYVGELIDNTLGGDWGKEEVTGNYTQKVYCIRGADIPDVSQGNKGKMPIRFILPKNYNNKKLHDGDLVVEISGGSPTQSTGRVAYISKTLLKRYDEGLVCTNFCRAVTPKAEYSMYLYHLWQYCYNLGLFFNFENGTTGIKNFDLTGFTSNYEIKIPDLSLVRRYNSVCESIYDKIYTIGLENEKLSSLRDSLLPKLMSGEIDVSNIKLDL